MANDYNELLLELAKSRLPELPASNKLRIGCVGSGFIMADCHLPSYSNMRWNLQGICSRNKEVAENLARLHHIKKIYSDVTQMCGSGNIDVLDIAVPPDVQPEIIFKALSNPGSLRGILAQKPLAMDIKTARQIVDACAKNNIRLAVNQNMRFDHSIRVAKSLLNRNLLGTPILATIEMRAIPHWMPWSEKLSSLSTYIMSIHHLDTFRYWFGSPERVFGSTTQDPRTKFNHRDGINLYILEYDSGLRASAWDDVWTGPAKEGASSDIYIRWRIEGTEGTARGTIGWPSYPTKTPSTLEFTNIKTQCWLKPEWTEAWFPDAFIGTMSQLLVAIEKNQEPEVSGQDNLETIALCEAIFQSSQSHKVLSPALFL